MTSPKVLVQRHGRVGILTLNRPEVRNAIDDEMAFRWEQALRAFADDDGIGAVVMTGAGSAFCAGADVGRFERAIEASADVDRETPAHLPAEGEPGPGAPEDWIELVRTTKPVIAAVNGPCVGAGLTRILPCDRIIASESATFSMRFVHMGLVPELGSTALLPQLVGWHDAMDLMLSGRTIDARHARDIGLVHDVIPPDQLVDRAVAVAEEWSRGPARTQQVIKQLVHANHREQDLSAVARREVDALDACWGSAENREAVAAFRERRPPRWSASSRSDAEDSAR